MKNKTSTEAQRHKDSKGWVSPFVFRLLSFALFLLPFALSAQNHPELNWRTFESEHFIFHYHEGTERSARMALTIAEEIYPHVTGLYQWEPEDKTQIIIQDTDDYANGGAYYFDNKILLWASPADFTLRGNHNWMRNVLTHEFAHIVSLGKSMRFPISIPAGFIQILNREKPVRDNIILEYPRGIAAFPFANVIIPMWFAEGLAQYQFEQSQYDYWDSVRDMLLRDQALNIKLISFNEMAHFGKKGTGNESVYNSGYAFVSYMAETYGSDFLRQITEEAGKLKNFSLEKSVKRFSGKDIKEIYAEYCKTLIIDYSQLTEKIRNNAVSGEIILDEGPGNFSPSWSPDGKSFIFASSRGQDYMGQTSLYHWMDGKVEKISGRTRGQVAWSSDGKKIYFVKRAKPDIYGSVWFDLFTYDFESEKEERLTKKQRVYSVALSESGQMFIITVHDGTHNIAEFNLESKEAKALTNWQDGEQVFSLAISPDEKTLYFDMALSYGRDIYSMNLADKSIKSVIFDASSDERHPVLSADGKILYYASDRTGIFNIYKKKLQSDEEDQLLSNVTGAAMYPAINFQTDSLAYSLFEDGQFKIALLDANLSVPKETAEYKNYHQPELSYSPSDLDKFDSKVYEDQFSRIFFMPYVMLDYGKIKLGSVLYQSEILNRFNLTASGAVNSIMDMDLYARLDYNKLLSSLYLEAFYVTYHLATKEAIWFGLYPEENTYDFSLWEVNLGSNYRFHIHNFDFNIAHAEYTSGVEVKTTIPPIMIYGYSFTYYKGTRYQFSYSSDLIGIDWRSNISPRRGFSYDLKLAYDNNQFISNLEINPEFGTLAEIYDDQSTYRVDLEAAAYVPIPKTKSSALGFELTTGYLANTKVDSFFHYFAGGMPGLKGYPFYTIEGTRLAVLTSRLRFPIIDKMEMNLHPIFFDKVYLSLYHQIGDAWRGGIDKINFKQNVGFELRFGGYSWYAYPLALSLDAVYALDEFKSYDKWVGKNWRYYVTLLFEF